MPEMPADEFVTVSQLARALGVGRRTVYKLIESGEIAATRPLWSYRIRYEEAMAAIERAEERAQQ